MVIEHTAPLTGGELYWPDDRYRELLLRAPRSIWSADAIEIAVSLVPGVRQVQVRDGWGGLDIDQSIFGNFNFIERLFGSERDLGSPYYFAVLVAPTPAAIWDGPDGLHAAVESAIEDLRPICIFPRVEQADQVGVGVAADLVVQGLPTPGRAATRRVNASPAGARAQGPPATPPRAVRRRPRFGEPVRSAEIIWALMNEPGIADVRRPAAAALSDRAWKQSTSARAGAPGVEELDCGANLELRANQVPVLVEDTSGLAIV